MKNILINGVSAKSAGGKSILTNLLNSISDKSSDFNYIVVVPENRGYEKFSRKNILIIQYNDSQYSFLKQVYFYYYYINRLIKSYNICLVFNLADVVIPFKVKQLFLFDWTYAVYPDSLVWRKMSLFEFLYRKIKLLHFKRYITYPHKIYAQTNSVKNRLASIYGLSNLSIIPNAVSLENIDGGIFKDFGLPKDRFNFLCLCKYYVHKNLEILIPLAKLIKLEQLPFSIIITIEQSEHKGAKKILESIKSEGLNQIIINVGSVDMCHVPSLYRQSSALLLPTLLESFSGTYVEAMYHEKPIFTSDIDFAKDVCGDSAIYFNPIDHTSIFSAIKKILDNKLMATTVEQSSKRLSKFLTWNEVSIKILEEINKNI